MLYWTTRPDGNYCFSFVWIFYAEALPKPRWQSLMVFVVYFDLGPINNLLCWPLLTLFNLYSIVFFAYGKKLIVSCTVNIWNIAIFTTGHLPSASTNSMWANTHTHRNMSTFIMPHTNFHYEIYQQKLLSQFPSNI